MDQKSAEQRFIDANALLEKSFTLLLKCNAAGKWMPQSVVHVEDIHNAPTVDAVKVVRCKNCRYYDARDPNEKRHPYAVSTWTGMCSVHDIGVEENDFCNRGEVYTDFD